MNESQRSTLITLTGALGCLLVAKSRRARRRSRLPGRISTRPVASWRARPVAAQTTGRGNRPVGDPARGRAPEVEPTVVRLRASQPHARPPRARPPRPATPAAHTVRAPQVDGRRDETPLARESPTPAFEDATVERVRATDLATPSAQPIADPDPGPTPVEQTIIAVPPDAAIVESSVVVAAAAGVVEAELPVVVAGVVEPVVVDGDVSSSVDGDVSSSVEDVADAPVAPVLAAEGVPMVVSEVAGDGEALVVEALVGRGCSERLARWLVAGARTHALPFAAQGDLRGAVRGELAGALPRFGGLPPAGALVAVVGSGGVGKTRVAAALAVAYGEGSALSARAVAVGGSREGSSLVGLLAGHGVPVTVSEQFAGRERRDGQLVVVDTPARSPADADAIAALAERLAVLEPDAVLIAMPASIGLGAARQLLAAFAPLGASGLVVTHVDETDQHGVAVELSIGTGVPLAYLHGGLELRSALALASPEHLAGALLP